MRLNSLILTSLILAGMIPVEGNAEDQTCERPNIVVLLADDLGYADVSWNNRNAYTETPNLDKLASRGAILTNCYSASSMCSPSRAGLLTGRVPTRVGIHDWIKEIYKKPQSDVHLRPQEVTFAELLKQKDYQTGVIGKWHLNNEFNTGNHSDPDDQGFDYWFCTPTHALPSHRNPDNFYDNGKAVGQMGSKENPVFSCQVVADKTIQWLDDREKDLPFALYIPFQEPHVVCDAPENIKNKYLTRIKNGKIPLKPGTGDKGLGQAEYYGCIENMDVAIGRILDKLEADGLLDNTMIVFSSDNGPDTNRRYQGRLQSVGETGKLRGRKRWLLEGGIRQATIFYLKGMITPGTKIDVPVGHIDLLPTFCDIVGIQPPADRVIDGSSIVPVLLGKSIDRKEKPLHWHFHAPYGGPNSVLRSNEWKITARWNKKVKLGRFDTIYINDIKHADLLDFKLFNVEVDPAEENDVKDQYPEILKSLKKQLIQVHKSVKEECPTSPAFQWNKKLQEIVDRKYDKIKD